MHEDLELPDRLNRRLLRELDIHSRRGVNEIARNLRMSEETLRYRLQKLEASGWLFKYHAIVDTARLGYSLYKVYLKLQSCSDKVIQKMLRFFSEANEVVSLIQTDGNYDLLAGVLISKVNELDFFIEKLLKQFHPYISKRSICVNIRSDYLPRDYFVSDRPRKNFKLRTYQATSEEVVKDRIDLLILRELGYSSRKTAAEIARTLNESKKVSHISRETVLYRLKKLEQSKIISGYNIVLQHRALGQLQYKVLIELNYAERDQLEGFLKTLFEEPNIVYVIKTLGEWDYEIEIEVNRVEEYKAVLMRVTEKHPGMVKNYSTLLLHQIHIYDIGRRIEQDILKMSS